MVWWSDISARKVNRVIILKLCAQIQEEFLNCKSLRISKRLKIQVLFILKYLDSYVLKILF